MPGWDLHLHGDRVIGITDADATTGWMSADNKASTDDAEWVAAAQRHGTVVVVVSPPSTITPPQHLLSGIDIGDDDWTPESLGVSAAAVLALSAYDPRLPVIERPSFRHAVAAGRVIGGAIAVASGTAPGAAEMS